MEGEASLERKPVEQFLGRCGIGDPPAPAPLVSGGQDGMHLGRTVLLDGPAVERALVGAVAILAKSGSKLRLASQPASPGEGLLVAPVAVLAEDGLDLCLPSKTARPPTA
jgi:hypothetical protein